MQNLIRIQIGYWSLIPLDTQEPYLVGAWDYLIKGVLWAQQFGLKVMIDLHGGTSSTEALGRCRLRIEWSSSKPAISG
jgi:aryl-phospho-beta-D-glucosidase BglC (GH1 family)